MLALLLCSFVVLVAAQPSDIRLNQKNCCPWAKLGECEKGKNPKYMRVHCPQACGTPLATRYANALDHDPQYPLDCAPQGFNDSRFIVDGMKGPLRIPVWGLPSQCPNNECQNCDRDIECDTWGKLQNLCEVYPFYLKIRCQKSCAACGVTMATAIGPLPEAPDGCRNDHEWCQFWSWVGECSGSNTPWMNEHCCQSCYPTLKNDLIDDSVIKTIIQKVSGATDILNVDLWPQTRPNRPPLPQK